MNNSVWRGVIAESTPTSRCIAPTLPSVRIGSRCGQELVESECDEQAGIGGELRHPDAQVLLSSAPLVRLAYNGPDGLPRVIPIGFYRIGERIVICTAPTSPKVRAFSSRPNVALTIDSGTTPENAKALLVRGRAAMETVDGVPEEYIAAAAKSLLASKVMEFERQVRSLYKQMVRIAIEPQWARFYDFGAGRIPAFLANLAKDG
jgi:nitroimidazol reductase NimA-like FMN-containing flavoprotein (pyridoxamine 5'-phosphate oxidase superfamily)